VGPLQETLGSARQLTLGLPGAAPVSVEYNVAAESHESTLHSFILQSELLRSAEPSLALKSGSYVPIDRNNPSVLFLSP